MRLLCICTNVNEEVHCCHIWFYNALSSMVLENNISTRLLCICTDANEEVHCSHIVVTYGFLAMQAML
jgi:hypothetical protein